MWSTTKTTQCFSRERIQAEPVEIWKARNFIHKHSGDELSRIGFEKARGVLRAQIITTGVLRASGPPETEAR